MNPVPTRLRRALTSLLSLLLTLSFVAACSKPQPTPPTMPPPADAGFLADAAETRMDASATPDAGFAPDTGPVGDNNDSFAEAVSIEINGQAIGHINPAGDFDYYKFEGTAGDWLVIYTIANPGNQLDSVDTVITLFDSAMNQLAENDDGLPRSSPDSEIIHYIATAGTYYIQVQEFSTWKADREPEGAASYRYRVKVDRFVAENNDYITIDAETGNDASNPNTLTFYPTTNAGYAMGTFASATDVDVYQFTISSGTNQNLRSQIMPAGPTGYGSTSGVGQMWITDVTGSTISARIDNSSQDLFALSPSILPGDYLLWVAHPGNAAGANDHYVIKSFVRGDNPKEQDDAANNSRSGAETINMSSATVRTGFVLVDLPEGDSDHFKFEVKAGEDVYVSCGSRTSGSGILDLTATVTDLGGTVIAANTETATSAAVLSKMTITSTLAYLQLSRGAQDMEVSGQWARCGIRAGVPQ